jgi:hypothetical protein
LGLLRLTLLGHLGFRLTLGLAALLRHTGHTARHSSGHPLRLLLL